jgi:hypothetical protein
VWGVLVCGDLITVGLPFLGFGAFAMLGAPELGVVAAIVVLAAVVATAALPRLRIGPDGIEVRNRFRRYRFPLGSSLRYRRYLFSSRGMEVPCLRVGRRWVPVMAATWLTKGGDSLSEDLLRSTRVSYQ